MHREDIKAALRKGFGTVMEFEVARGLPPRSVHDVLRGRANAAAEAAIADELQQPLHVLFPLRHTAEAAAESTNADNSPDCRDAHRLTAKAS